MSWDNFERSGKSFLRHSFALLFPQPPIHKTLCIIYQWTNFSLDKGLTLFLTLLTTTAAWCQVTVSGTVIFKDDNSTSPGIVVVEKGTKNGTTTDINGKFSITVSDPNATLVFSFIGAITREFQLKGKNDIFV